MVDESVVKIVRKYLKTLVELGISVRYVVVFGSQAVGRQHPLSDIDLLVVSPLFDGKRKREDVNFLWLLPHALIVVLSLLQLANVSMKRTTAALLLRLHDVRGR